MIKFNINNHMYIQINESGWEHLKKTVGDNYIKHCIENRKIEVENEVWYRLQCHQVFDLFSISNDPMFNTNVMFDDNILQELEKEKEIALKHRYDSEGSEGYFEGLNKAIEIINNNQSRQGYC